VNVRDIEIAGRRIGDGAPAYVIAEAGSNHNRDLDTALRLVRVAAESGADAVKFQTFNAESMYARKSSKVEYLQKLGIDKSIFEIIAEIEMPTEWIPTLARAAADARIHFLSTPFDEHSANLLAPHMPAFKIASYELTHIPLIRHVAGFRKPVILSTGAASLEEISEAVETVRAERAPVALTQCTACYPAPEETINVRAIQTLKSRFAVPAGLSDHSLDPIIAPVAAVAAGANLIEKHFTLSRGMAGPDHSYAIEPDELKAMVAAIRRTEKTLGTGVKALQAVEHELVNFRRSVFTASPIKAGHRLKATDLVVLRRAGEPASDLAPRDLQSVIGMVAVRDLDAQQMLTWSDVRRP
jgi:N,N'-diacetyllegionaminate synthase